MPLELLVVVVVFGANSVVEELVPTSLFPVEVLVVFGVLAALLVRVGLSEGLAAVLFGELLVFASAPIRDFVKCLVAAKTGMVGIVSVAVAIANSRFNIPYPVLSSHPGTSMSLAVFRRMFLICWRLSDGLAAHICQRVFVTTAAAIDVPCFVSVVDGSAVCGLLICAKISSPSP